MAAKGVRLDRDLWHRAEALAPLVAIRNPELCDALGHDITPQDVLRLAVRRGLSELEGRSADAGVPPHGASSTAPMGDVGDLEHDEIAGQGEELS